MNAEMFASQLVGDMRLLPSARWWVQVVNQPCQSWWSQVSATIFGWCRVWKPLVQDWLQKPECPLVVWDIIQSVQRGCDNVMRMITIEFVFGWRGGFGWCYDWRWMTTICPSSGGPQVPGQPHLSSAELPALSSTHWSIMVSLACHLQLQGTGSSHPARARSVFGYKLRTTFDM